MDLLEKIDGMLSGVPTDLDEMLDVVFPPEDFETDSEWRSWRVDPETGIRHRVYLGNIGYRFSMSGCFGDCGCMVDFEGRFNLPFLSGSSHNHPGRMLYRIVKNWEDGEWHGDVEYFHRILLEEIEDEEGLDRINDDTMMYVYHLTWCAAAGAKPKHWLAYQYELDVDRERMSR